MGGAEAVTGELGQISGLPGRDPGKRARGPGKAAVSTEGHLLLESPMLPSPFLSSRLLGSAHFSGPPTDSPVLTQFPALRPQHSQVSRCAQWPQRTTSSRKEVLIPWTGIITQGRLSDLMGRARLYAKARSKITTAVVFFSFSGHRIYLKVSNDILCL